MNIDKNFSDYSERNIISNLFIYKIKTEKELIILELGFNYEKENKNFHFTINLYNEEGFGVDNKEYEKIKKQITNLLNNSFEEFLESNKLIYTFKINFRNLEINNNSGLDIYFENDLINEKRSKMSTRIRQTIYFC